MTPRRRDNEVRVSPRIVIGPDEIEWNFARSSGPGGQNVNKVATKATLRWRVADSPGVAADVRERFAEAFASRLTDAGVLVLSSQRYRQQSRNVDDCLDRLRAMLASVAVAPRQRRRRRVSRAATEARLEEKRRTSQRKTMRQPPAAE
ncbi:MAG: alternative ribosome rescue aminoacyl-tRNA hydrolase ArfB [Pirellulales bacterium]|nr:aminoacyl-tRNA hydrolase [Planctomycetales bacterium]